MQRHPAIASCEGDEGCSAGRQNGADWRLGVRIKVPAPAFAVVVTVMTPVPGCDEDTGFDVAGRRRGREAQCVPKNVALRVTRGVDIRQH